MKAFSLRRWTLPVLRRTVFPKARHPLGPFSGWNVQGHSAGDRPFGDQPFPGRPLSALSYRSLHPCRPSWQVDVLVLWTVPRNAGVFIRYVSCRGGALCVMPWRLTMRNAEMVAASLQVINYLLNSLGKQVIPKDPVNDCVTIT